MICMDGVGSSCLHLQTFGTDTKDQKTCLEWILTRYIYLYIYVYIYIPPFNCGKLQHFWTSILGFRSVTVCCVDGIACYLVYSIALSPPDFWTKEVSQAHQTMAQWYKNEMDVYSFGRSLVPNKAMIFSAEPLVRETEVPFSGAINGFSRFVLAMYVFPLAYSHIKLSKAFFCCWSIAWW